MNYFMDDDLLQLRASQGIPWRYRFNQARSYTKFFDITQAGAAGIYARSAIFAEVIEDGHNGLLVEMDPQQWIEAIQALVADEQGRRAMHANAVSTVARLSE